MTDVVWRPSKEYLENSNAKRLMDKYGIKTYQELIQKSVEDIAWFWDAAMKDMNIEFYEPYSKVYDDSKGIEWTKWFIGGKLNIIHNLLDKHLKTDVKNKIALKWVSETGETKQYTYEETAKEVAKLANAFKKMGIKKGDRIALYMQMLPEAAFTFLAILQIGAVFMPIFSGFGPEAAKVRLEDVGARVLVTSNFAIRRGKKFPQKENADLGVEGVKSIEKVVVVQRTKDETPWTNGRDVWYHDFVAGMEEDAPTEVMDSEDIAMVLYSSGTTGKPKGTVHTHGGAIAIGAMNNQYYLDVQPTDTYLWISNFGWMMGPFYVMGALLQGATALLYEGALDYPSPDQLWKLVADHGITILGISPTAIRALIPYGEEMVNKHDLSKLRIVGSTGEPWDDESWMWFFKVVGKERVPIINISGGTELFGCFLSSVVAAPLKPKCFHQGLAMDIDVVDDDGNPLVNEIGHLICRKPFPSMTRGFWQDPQRYLDTYWSRFKGVWFHGDLAMRDEENYWWLFGRSDDTLKIAGKRMGPAEIEEELIAHDSVIEAGAFGIPDPVKGQAIGACVVLKEDVQPSADLEEELKDLVATKLGKPFKPKQIIFVPALPKTRSGKILRRLLKKAYMGEDLGDTTDYQNGEVFDLIKQQSKDA